MCLFFNQTSLCQRFQTSLKFRLHIYYVNIKIVCIQISCFTNWRYQRSQWNLIELDLSYHRNVSWQITGQTYFHTHINHLNQMEWNVCTVSFTVNKVCLEVAWNVILFRDKQGLEVLLLQVFPFKKSKVCCVVSTCTIVCFC